MGRAPLRPISSVAITIAALLKLVGAAASTVLIRKPALESEPKPWWLSGNQDSGDRAGHWKLTVAWSDYAELMGQ